MYIQPNILEMELWEQDERSCDVRRIQHKGLRIKVKTIALFAKVVLRSYVITTTPNTSFLLSQPLYGPAPRAARWPVLRTTSVC